jgi:hypothetical protein
MTPAATSPRTACSAWRLIPKDKHYLCVGLADLQDIISDYGGNTLKHGISIAPGLVWVNPLLRSPFSKCPCANRAIPQARPGHSCPVQHIISPKLQSVMRGGPLNWTGARMERSSSVRAGHGQIAESRAPYAAQSSFPNQPQPFPS